MKKLNKPARDKNPANFPRVAIPPEIHRELKKIADDDDGKSLYRYCASIFRNHLSSKGIFLPEK